jgi:hypothetical protein
MANDVSGRPWVFDTASPGSIVWPPPPAGGWPSSFTPDGKIDVDHFEYAGYGAQGNQIILKDKNGKIVWFATGAADLEEVRSGKVGWINGLIVDTLQGNGKCLVYLK